MATEPTLAKRRPPERPPEPAEDYQPAPRPGSFGSAGFNNARTLLGERGVAVGRAAQQANPGAQKLRWRDIAQAAGIEDFRGARRDERFRDLQDAFYGHADVGGVVDPERQRLKTNMLNYYTTGAGAGVGGGGGVGGNYGGGGAGGGSDRWSLEGGTEGFIKELLSGKGGPYSEEVIGRETAEATNRRAADLANANRNAAIAQARGGVAGPAAAAMLAANSREARGGLSSDVADIRQTATLKNHESRVQGLQAGLQELENRRNYELGQARNANERLSIQRRYDADMAQVNAQLEISKNQLDQAAREAAAGRGAAASAQSREQDFWKERFGMQNERSDYEFQRNLPLEFLNLGMGSLGDSFGG